MSSANLAPSPAQIREIVELHRQWIESGGIKGKKAELQGANLNRAELQGARLRRANLSEATLSGARLQEADLS